MAGTNSTATYTVITDTHGYPWGETSADFDLGDNTNAYPNEKEGKYYFEALHSTNVQMRIYGNHDVWQEGHGYGGLQSYPDPKNQVMFFGLDSCKGFNDFEIPEDQLRELVTQMQELKAGWDVAILTHIPVFPKTIAMGKCYSGPVKNYTQLTEILNAYRGRDSKGNPDSSKRIGSTTPYTPSGSLSKYTIDYDFSKNSGNIIGCFCGHVHNHIQIYVNGIYMESFNTNGSGEWATDDCGNAGLYQPTTNKIRINFTTKEVNEWSYVNGVKLPAVNKDHNSGKKFAQNASGQYTMHPTSTAYPKFYQKRYVGYSYSASGGPTSANTIGAAWWPVDSVYVYGLNVIGSVKCFRFDAAGKLRYYSISDYENTNDQKDSVFREIPNYQNTTIVFDTVNSPSTSPGKTWTFKNGLFEGVRSTPSFSYASGTILGKNGYAIKFNSSGLATGITLNGASATYPAGENWINVYDIRIYKAGFGDLTSPEVITSVPQIGITGTFSSSGTKLNLARANSNGTNRIRTLGKLLMRVVGNNNSVYWFYDGCLTNLTDSKVGI